jgi:hypothetical protein
MPDSTDMYSSNKNTHLPGEYGSIYVYKEDFRPFYTYEEINQQQQEATNFIERVRLEQQLQFEERKREKEKIEREKREQANRKAWEEIKKNLKGPKNVVEYDDVLY